MINISLLEEGLNLSHQLDILMDDVDQLPALESIVGDDLSPEFDRAISALRDCETIVSMESLAGDVWKSIKAIVAKIWKWITNVFKTLTNSSVRRRAKLNDVIKILNSSTEETFKASMDAYKPKFDSAKGFLWLRTLNKLAISNSWVKNFDKDIIDNLEITKVLNDIGIYTNHPSNGIAHFAYGNKTLSAETSSTIKMSLVADKESDWTLVTFKKFVQSLSALQASISKIKFNSVNIQDTISKIIEDGTFASKDEGVRIATERVRTIQHIVMVVVMMNNSLSNFALSSGTYLAKHIIPDNTYA